MLDSSRLIRIATAASLVSLSMACSSQVSIQILPGDESRTARVLRFEGPYDRVEVPSSSLLDVPSDFAVEAWVRIDGYDGGHGVFNRWQRAVGDIELTFGVPEPVPVDELPSPDPVPSHTLAAWGYVSPTVKWITAYTSALPSPGQWHHLAMSYGGGSMKLYVDGSLWASASGTDPVSNPTARVFIGATQRTERLAPDADAGDYFWPPMPGAIADVRMSSVDRYPAAFTPERHLASDESTLALWRLDEGDGSVARDSGPNHLDGSITGAAWSDVPSR
jgi:Concanavalin A-like lectin/glucanases superfamily